MSTYFNSATGGTFSPHYSGMGTNPRSFQAPLNTAYGAAGLEPFKVYDADFIPYGDTAIPHPDQIARDLIATTIECQSAEDYDEALNEALELYTRATAWEDLKKTLTNPNFVGKSTQNLFLANYPTFKADLAPAIEGTLASIVEAARKLEGITNPFDNNEVVGSMCDVVAVHALIRGLTRLGALSAIHTIGAAGPQNRLFPQPLAELLMYVNLEDPQAPMWTDRNGVFLPNTEYDPVVQSVRDINSALEHTNDVATGYYTRTPSERWEYIDTDLVLFYIARGDLEGMSLDYTHDAAELKRRTDALTAATTPVAMTPDQYYSQHPELARPKRMPQELVLNKPPRDPATQAFNRN